MEMTLTLTKDELKNITGYSRARKQLEVMRQLGIPARLRPDNSVLVLRMHLNHPATQMTAEKPRLKLR
jgi:hypothetical protein